MKKTTSEKIKLGFFVILGTLFLVIAAYLIGNNQDLFSKTFAIEAVFRNTNGLQLGNNVRFAGINVGTVKGIDMVNDTVIRVEMVIQQKMQKHIKKDAIATIGSDGLVGSMIINIIPDKGNVSTVEEGDEIASYSRIGTEDMLSTLNTTNENAALLTADLLKVTRALNNGEGTFGRLLNDKKMATDLHLTIINLKNASNGVSTLVGELNTMVEKMNFEKSTLGVLLGDSISADKMKNSISNLEKASQEIEKLSMDLSAITKETKEGKGAIQYLSTDTTLVNRLNRTMQNIEEGTERFNENMEALKHSFLTRRYFKKQKKNNASETDKQN